MAGERRLAVIGWMMLKSNEPYRYAIPRKHRNQVGQAARERHRESGVREAPAKA